MYASFSCRNKLNDNTNISIKAVKEELNAIFSEEFEPDRSSFQLIDGRMYQKNLVILQGDVLFNIARKQWRQAEETALAETNVRIVDVSEVRKQVVEILSLCRYSLKECLNSKGSLRDLLQNKLLRYLKLLRNTIVAWSDLEERSLIKLASPSVSDEQLPIYHYFHMYLDVQWLLLTLNYLCGGPLDAFEALLKDLVTFSQILYKKRNQNVAQASPFVCSCVKRVWLLMQIFSETLCGTGTTSKHFWEVFNDTLKDVDDTFSLWLLNHVATLQGYNEEGEFVGPLNVRVLENNSLMDQKLKAINTKCTNITSDNNQTPMLLNCCKLVDPLLNQWWVQSARSEPYQILWEIFNKHINLSFGVNKINSAVELVELVDHILSHSSISNSYEYFLRMLNEHLTKFPNQWPRMRGRIYCKLPPQKINDFSDIGLSNIALLFLSLASTVSLAEMTEKLSSLLSNLRGERRKSPLVLHIHMSLVILHVHRGYPIKEVCNPLLQLVQEASSNREMFHFIRLYIDGFDAVLNVSQNFSLQQHVLIGSWVLKYMTCCQYSDLCYFLNVLLCNFKRIYNAGACSDWEYVFKEHVLPGLKPVAVSANAPLQVGELAALIDPNPSSDWVLTFTADPIAPKVTCQFMSTLLEDVTDNYVLPKNHETAILHAWIRCCLLKCEDSEKLTRNVMKIRTLALVFNTKLDFNDKPLISFIISMGKLTALPNLRELCEQCFGRLDSWVVDYLKAPPTEALTLHMYTCLALLFFHCAPLLYHKSRLSCLLNRLISVFLLPTDVLMGNSPHPYVLSAIQRTWHRFVEGIFALDCSSDAYLERTLRDMVVRYLPLLSLAESPILKCFGNEKLAKLILEKISCAFLSRSTRSSDGNTTKALKIVHLSMESASNIETLKMIVQSSLTSVLEVIMYHVHKNAAIDVVKFISSCDKYGQLKESVQTAIMVVTEKHLAFNANSYFQFTNTLAKVIPVDVRVVFPSIKKQVVEVERMRGVGYDNTLRQGLDRLEMLLV